MGVCIRQEDGDFFIPVASVGPCADAVYEAFNEGGERQELLSELTLEQSWELDLDDNGNVIAINFIGDKAFQEEELFKAMAPYVQTGSYIEISDEYGGRYRYVFTKGVVDTKNARISWD